MATTAPAPLADTPLGRELAEAIHRDGAMPFATFMERCLYDPCHGYYAAAARAVGRQGDFHTSVSVGPVFGELLAAWAARSWKEIGRPAALALVEQGAHDGRLMGDVLAALSLRHPALREVVQPIIVEPLPARRQEQQNRLAEHASVAGDAVHADPAGPTVAWVGSLDDLAQRPLPPVLYFANELLDAFPVERWRYDGQVWHRLAVAVGEHGGFIWQAIPAPGFQLPAADDVDTAAFPAGYETETCPSLAAWTESLARAIDCGRVLIVDYGRSAAEYFAPHRTAGTLRGYRHHRRCDDPFASPGEADLTADVNFDHLAEEARRAGFVVHPPERQGTFLTRLAEPHLLQRPAPDAAWCRQFQTLTHPNQLGHVFQAMVLEKTGRSPR